MDNEIWLNQIMLRSLDRSVHRVNLFCKCKKASYIKIISRCQERKLIGRLYSRAIIFVTKNLVTSPLVWLIFFYLYRLLKCLVELYLCEIRIASNRSSGILSDEIIQKNSLRSSRTNYLCIEKKETILCNFSRKILKYNLDVLRVMKIWSYWWNIDDFL